MRGLVFSEFLDFVEDQAGPEMVETMIDSCDLPSGGAYTTVGFYEHEELLRMLAFLNTARGTDVAAMVRGFGQHLFGRLAGSHPALLGNGRRLLDFLEGIETHIHCEVRKLYPDAELPRFEAERRGPGDLVLNYRSSRPFADLAQGMIEGAAAWFQTPIALDRHDHEDARGFAARFQIRAA
jgi:hypothetical protein